MSQHRHAIAEVRDLSLEERSLLHWLLDHGTQTARGYLETLDDVRVVSRCACGCASVNFLDGAGAFQILADFRWRDGQGNLFGVFAFAFDDTLAGLEVWSIDGATTPVGLPSPAHLEPM